MMPSGTLGAGSGALWTHKGIREIERKAREGAVDPGKIHLDEVTKDRRVTWQDEARKRKIPEEYWPLVDLEPFSALTNLRGLGKEFLHYLSARRAQKQWEQRFARCHQQGRC